MLQMDSILTGPPGKPREKIDRERERERERENGKKEGRKIDGKKEGKKTERYLGNIQLVNFVF